MREASEAAVAAVGDDAFRRVVEWAPTAMVLVDADGRIVLVNAQAERVFGYAREALVGRSVDMLVPTTLAVGHPAYRQRFMADPQPRPMGFGRDLYARRQDGSQFPVEIGLTPIETETGPMVLAAIVDITERKRHEMRFQRVVEYAPSAMVMIDAAGRITLVNAQCEQLFGYPRQDLIGEPVELLVPERLRGDHAGLRRGFQGAAQARPMGVGRDLFARRADGSEFPVEIGLNPIDTEEGVVVLASIVDITERLRVRQTLEKALQEKTVLLNELHHRVKNNLQVIVSLLNLQAQHITDPGLRALLSDSQSRIRALALTHQLLYERKDYTRIDLGEYLGRLAQLLASLRPAEKRIDLRCEMPSEAQFVDIERAIPCGLIVNELVTNAYKHAFVAGRAGEIVIELHRRVGSLEVVVADNGPGLPDGFDPATLTSLGLQLVLLLADQMGAQLGFESHGGARFRLWFPLPATARSPS